MFPNVKKLQGMAGNMVPLPDVNKLKEMAGSMTPSVDSLVDKFMPKFDPVAYVKGLVEQQIGFTIDPNAGPESKELVTLQILIRASAEIPLDALDPLKPYNMQADMAIAGKSIAQNDETKSKQ